jgi:hypothetical protein
MKLLDFPLFLRFVLPNSTKWQQNGDISSKPLDQYGES